MRTPAGQIGLQPVALARFEIGDHGEPEYE